MKAFGIVLGAVAYTLGSWGFILIKGYNVTLTQWVSPLHPFNGAWPPQCVPPGYIFPTTAAAGVPCKAPAPQQTGSNSPGTKRDNRAAQQAHRPSPGSVGGRF